MDEDEEAFVVGRWRGRRLAEEDESSCQLKLMQPTRKEKKHE